MKENCISNYLFQFVLVTLCFFSCSKEDDYNSPLRNLVISSQTVEADVSVSEVSVNVENLRNMDVKSSESWCKANVLEKSIRLNLEPNKTYDDRSTTIILTDPQDGTSTSFIVTQKMNVAIIIGNYDTNVIPEEGGILTLDVQSNVDYQVSIPADIDWIKVQNSPTRGLKNSNVNLSIVPNNSGNVRTAEVKLVDNNSKSSQSISIYQELTPRIQIDKDSISVDEYGGEIAIKVISNVVCEIDNWSNWVEIRDRNDVDNFNFTQIINVAPMGESSEDRKTELYIRAKDFDTKTTLTINQNRRFFIKEKNVELSTDETYQPTLFNTTEQNVTWKSSDPSIVSVDNNGLLKGGHAGTCTITATTADLKYSASIEASVALVFKLGISETITLGPDESKIITLDNNSGQDVIWISSDTNVAQVDDKGNVTAIGNGEATITVSTTDGKCSASIDVNVIIEFKISFPLSGLYYGELGVLSLITNTGQTVSWHSSDNSVITVDENGIIKGVGYGTATITAISSDGRYKDEVTIKVYNINDELTYKCEHSFYGTSSPFGSFREDVVTCRLYNYSSRDILLSKCTAYKDGVLLESKIISMDLNKNDSYEIEFTIPSNIGGTYKFVWEYSLPPTRLTYECVYEL